ncbi:MAG: S41 family peptidase [Candidatus Eremiobacteraeota bacterium]|nr:S41 family peptidase [Candidatus Eremiobacteraeota bacterium]
MIARSLGVAFALSMALGLTGLASAAATDDVGRSMLDYSFERASSEFYKKTSPQELLDGAVKGMRAIVKKGGGDPNKIATLRDAGNDSADIAALNHELLQADRDFGQTVGVRNIAYAAIDGMLASLHDRWTVFMTPREYRSLNEGLDGGNFAGVGIVIDVDPNTKSLLVVQTIDGGPAEKAGIQAGDLILTVDDKSTQGLTTEQDSALIRGKAGTVVQLSVQRAGATKPLSVTITRETIHAPSVRSRVLDGNIGYVQVLVFGLTTGQELSAAMQKLDKQGVKGVILDLRNNGGGYLNAAIDVSSLFVSEGPIVSIDSRTKPLTTFDAENTAVAPRPLAVLVNGFTASASEITSGAIQDSGAGVLIGSRTFGKGVVQTIYPLPDGSAIKITTARYLTPNGRDINAVGIAPDIAVGDVKANDFGKPAADGQLQRALVYIQDKIAAGNGPENSKPVNLDGVKPAGASRSAQGTSRQ